VCFLTSLMRCNSSCDKGMRHCGHDHCVVCRVTFARGSSKLLRRRFQQWRAIRQCGPLIRSSAVLFVRPLMANAAKGCLTGGFCLFGGWPKQASAVTCSH